MGDRSLVRVLTAARRDRRPAVIVDVKHRSPRDGELISGSRLVPYVRALVAAKVDALATVTEPRHFGGSMESAGLVRRVADRLALIRKDFFRTTEHLEESADAGFDAVQLTVRTIADRALLAMLKTSAEKLGLDVVVGVHDKHELELAVELGARIVGINNRNIADLETTGGTVGHTESLAALVPEDLLIISESGIATAEDARRAFRAGADAVLVGTAMATSEDPAAFLDQLRRSG